MYIRINMIIMNFTHHHRVQLVVQIVRILVFVQPMIVEVGELAIDDRRLRQTRRHETLPPSGARFARIRIHWSLRWTGAVVVGHTPPAIVLLKDRLNRRFLWRIQFYGRLRQHTVLLNAANIVPGQLLVGIDYVVARVGLLLVVQQFLGGRLMLEQLFVPQNGFLRHGRQIGCRVKVLEREVDHLLRLYPTVVDVVESFQMDNL